MSADAAFSAMAFPRLRIAPQDRVDEQAKAHGHAAGYAEGIRLAGRELEARIAQLDAEHAIAVRHGQAKVDRAIEVLNAAVSALNARTVPVLRDAETTLIGTAVQLAESILGSELGSEETSARRALARALDHSEPAGTTTVRMHPDDLAILDDGALAQSSACFVSDPTLARGDAVTEFAEGYLDARIGAALDRMRSVLLGES